MVSHLIVTVQKAAKVISERIMADSLGEDSLDGVLTLGWYLLLHHRDQCNHGVLVDTQHDVVNLESWFKDTIEREGTQHCASSCVFCTLCSSSGSSVLAPESSDVGGVLISNIRIIRI